jgi:hypothetical protein
MVARSLAVEEVMEKLKSFLHVIVALQTRRSHLLRAAGVGWENHAIPIFDPHPRGTATLMAELLRAGATHS